MMHMRTSPDSIGHFKKQVSTSQRMTSLQWDDSTLANLPNDFGEKEMGISHKTGV